MVESYTLFLGWESLCSTCVRFRGWSELFSQVFERIKAEDAKNEHPDEDCTGDYKCITAAV